MTRLSVLLIDDDPILRKLYEQRFRKAGFDVLLATNGQEGTELALAHRPQAILLDLMLPVKGGLGVLDILKTLPETKDIPVIILTAYPVQEYREKSARVGAAQFISKAETMPGDVVAKVQDLLKQSEKRDEQ